MFKCYNSLSDGYSCTLSCLWWEVLRYLQLWFTFTARLLSESYINHNISLNTAWCRADALHSGWLVCCIKSGTSAQEGTPIFHYALICRTTVRPPTLENLMLLFVTFTVQQFTDIDNIIYQYFKNHILIYHNIRIIDRWSRWLINCFIKSCIYKKRLKDNFSVNVFLIFRSTCSIKRIHNIKGRS